MQQLLLVLLPALVQGPEAIPEWAPAFDVATSAGVGGFQVGAGQVAARDDRWLLGSRESGSIVDAGFAVHLFDSLAVEQWRSNEDPAVFAFGDFDCFRIDELEFSVDGQLAFAVLIGSSDQVSLRARSVLDGSLVWSRDSDQSYEAVAGTLGVWPSALVLAEGRTVFMGNPSSELVGLDPATGNVLWSRTEALQQLFVRKADPAANVAIVSGYLDNTIRALDVATGQELWAVPGLNQDWVRVDANSGSVVIGSASGVRAHRLSNGGLLWSQAQPAKTLAASGSNTLVVSQGTSAPGLPHSVRLIDDASGAVLWTTALPDTGFANFVGVAADPSGSNAIAWGSTLSSGFQLFRLNGTSGSLLGSSPLSQMPSEAAWVSKPSGGVWALAGSDPAAQGVDSSGAPAWTVQPPAFAAPKSRVFWMETRPLIQRVHLVWMHEDYQTTGPQGRYEERDLTTGALISTFDITGTFGNGMRFALNATGSELAWTGFRPTLGAPTRLEKRDTATGTALVSIPWSSLGEAGLHFAQDNQSLLAAREVGDNVFAERIGPSGTVAWSTTYTPQGSVSLDLGATLRLQASGDLFLAYSQGSWPQAASSRLCRINQATGQTVAIATYNVDSLLGDSFGEQIVDVVELPTTGRLALLVDGFGSGVGTGLQQRSRLAFVGIQALGLVSQADLMPSDGFNTYVPVAGQLGALPDGSGAVVVIPGSSQLEVARFDSSSGSAVWTTPFAASQGLGSTRLTVGPGGRTVLVQADVPVFGQAPIQALLAYDMLTGQVLFTGSGLGAGLPSGTTGIKTVGGLAWVDQRVLFTGKGSGLTSDAGALRGLEIGSLLDGAEAQSLAAGGNIPQVLMRGANRAGNFYLLAGSATGTSPGIPLDFVVAPLAFDSYTLASLEGIGGPLFQGTFGVLDAAGTARANLALPPTGQLALAGITLYHAAIDWSQGLPIDGVSTPTSFQLTF